VIQGSRISFLELNLGTPNKFKSNDIRQFIETLLDPFGRLADGPKRADPSFNEVLRDAIVSNRCDAVSFLLSGFLFHQGIRIVMKRIWGWNHGWMQLLPIVGASWLGSLTCSEARADEDPPVTTKTSTVVVVSSDDGGGDEVVAKLREQLGKSGLPKEQQEKILSQVESAMANAMKAKAKAWTAKESTDENGQRSIVVRVDGHKLGEEGSDKKPDSKTLRRVIIAGPDGKTKEIDVSQLDSVNGIALERLGALGNLDAIQLNGEGLAGKLPEMFKGRVLQMATEGPTYRIGIAINRNSNEDGAETEDIEGLTVEEVMEDSPALEAGIEEGDIVISVNGQELEKFEGLQEAVQKAGKAGESIALQIIRDGKEIYVEVKPTKTESSDIGSMNIKLAPESGFIFEPGQLGGGGIPGMAVPGIALGDHVELRKEVNELKSEIGELKMLIKQLLEKDK
jgi:hypothetical protein